MIAMVISLVGKYWRSRHNSIVFSAALLGSSLLLGGCNSMIATGTGSTPIGTENGHRTFSQWVRDDSINRSAVVNLYKLDNRFKSQSRINTMTMFDAVLIVGQVPDPHLKTLASQSIQAIPEVQTVHNELVVGPQISFDKILQDSLIEQVVKNKLLLANNFPSSQVKVEVEDAVVYLMGKLTQADIDTMARILGTVADARKIVSLIDVLPPDSALVNYRSINNSSNPPSGQLPSPVYAAATVKSSDVNSIPTLDRPTDTLQPILNNNAPVVTPPAKDPLFVDNLTEDYLNPDSSEVLIDTQNQLPTASESPDAASKQNITIVTKPIGGAPVIDEDTLDNRSDEVIEDTEVLITP